MKYNTRHIILPMMAAMACAVVSCTSDLDSGAFVGTVSKEEMKFEVAAGSRTEVTTNDNIIEQPFMLFGDVSSSGAYFEGVKPIFDWDKVSFDKGKRTWDYGVAKQYWFMGQEHSFVAIHPFIPKGDSDSQVSILTYKDSELSFTYSLPEKLEDAKDLLFATHRRKYSLDNKGPVYFKFTHLLPRINVSLALIEKELMYDHVDENDDIGNPLGNKNEYIKVHSLEFNGIKTKASFSFSPVSLKTGESSTYDYKKSYLIRDDDKVENVVVTLKNACIVPNSHKNDVEDYEVEYVTALTGSEIIVMLPQSFDSDSEATMVVNYSINEDKDLERRIVIPLKNTIWREGTIYTYKLLIDNAYYNHIVENGKMIVDIEDFRLAGRVGDDSWITDDEDEDHNINYRYENGDGDCGPVE